MKKKATVEDIKKLVKVLLKYKVPKPYYIKVENPKEGDDPLEGWKPVGDIIYKGDIRNV